MSSGTGYGSIIYNDVDLSTTTYGLTLTSLPLPHFSDPKVDIQRVAHGGGVTQGQFYESLTLEVGAIVTGSSESDLRSKVESIAGVFDVDSDKTLIFEYEGWDDKRWWARLSRGAMPVAMGLRAARYRLVFTAANPFGESTTLNTENYTPLSDAHTFYVPSNAAEVIGGNYPAAPIYTLTAVGANPANLAIKNVTRDEELVYVPILPNTHLLKIDTENFLAQKSTDGGTTWTDVIGSVDSGPFPKLTEGLRNEMLLTNGDNTTLVVTYRDRYIGG